MFIQWYFNISRTGQIFFLELQKMPLRGQARPPPVRGPVKSLSTLSAPAFPPPPLFPGMRKDGLKPNRPRPAKKAHPAYFEI